MSELLNYLNSPDLVANFQKVFGIESHFDHNHESNSRNGGDLYSSSNGKDSMNGNGVSNGGGEHLGPRNHARKTVTSTVTTNGSSSTSQHESDEGSSKKKSHKRTLSNMKTDHSHIVANTTIHSRFFWFFFHLGAAMGNEVFYCLFFPFWFWNVDGAIARKVGFLWGVFMYFGQVTKDFLCMPRPASPPVVKLESRYVAEYGFPSTHAMVSAGNQD